MKIKQTYALLAGLLVSVGAHAQKTQDLVADEVVVTATRFEEPAGKEAIGVAVITAEDIRKSGARTLPQLLTRQSGIGFRDNSGSPDPQIDLRGFGVTGDQNTLVLLDGIRMNENELTTVRWSSIPLESIERVEILRGSGAVLYGGGATGGVINIITRNPSAGEKSGNVILRGGSYDARGGAASAAIASDKIGLRVGTQYDETDNYRDHNALRQRNADVTLRTLGNGPSLTFSGGAEAQDLELPGARNQTQVATDRRGATSLTDFADRKSEYARLTGTLPIAMGDLATDIGYRHKRIDAVLFSPIRTNTTAWNFSPRLRLPYEGLGAQHTLVAGFDLEDWDYDSDRPDPFVPVHVRADQTNEAFYLQHTTDLSTGTRLTVGGRIQNSTSHARDTNNPAPYASGRQDKDLYAYEAALRQQLTSSISAYVKAGHSFRVATLDENFAQFGGPFFDSLISFLEPQTSNDREIGLQLSQPGLQGRIAVFQMNLRNEIHLNADPLVFRNVNLPPTERYGFEFDLSKNLTDFLSTSLSYTYTVAKFTEGTFDGADVSGHKVPLVPTHRASASVEAKLGERTRLNVAATYTGEQYFDGDEANNFGQKMPDYTVVDLKLSHSIANWTISASANNLFNADYFSYAVRSQSTPGVFNAYPQPERNYFLTAEYRFGR
jgi:iron complex outermembrane recepter protein